MKKRTNLLTDKERAAFSTMMAKFGRIGGRIGGKKSSANMTPEQRRERAIKANLASQESKRRKKAEREGTP